MIINRPVRFTGSDEEAAANFRTHYWAGNDPDARCGECDCKPWHAAARYPCGVEPPRETVEVK
jgi:hypothetical protein